MSFNLLGNLYQQKLTEDDLQKVKQRYNAIDATKATLKAGKVKTSSGIPLSFRTLHYAILDLDDKSVVNALFEEEKAQKLKTAYPFLAAPLPEDIAVLSGDISSITD
ncbi:hypothetical protein EDC96DRAFT_581383 [Choanephora cucurbitarum]|nr:hypothetical protein EDC96DRAFT_581383 [Choanephora cucurbitarum]